MRNSETSNILSLQEFSERKDNKQGGRNDAGELGGIYEKEGEKFLIKKDKKVEKVMAEYLASRIYHAIRPDYSPEVFLVNTNNPGQLSEEGKDIYIASKYIKNYQGDLFKINTGYRDRPMAVGSFNRGKLKDMLYDKGRGFRYDGFPQVMGVSLLIGDFDLHSGNIGVVREPEKKDKLVRIDFGGAFEKLNKEVHPNSITRHPFGFGPTNHFREFPRKLKLTPEFIKELKEIAKDEGGKITNAINSAIDDMAECYSMKPLKSFAKRLGVERKNRNVGNKEDLVNNIKAYTRELIDARKQSLLNYATEIEIDLWLTKHHRDQNQDQDNKKDQEDFKKIIKSNEKYFEGVQNNNQKYSEKELKKNKSNFKEKLHFRDPSHKNEFNPWSSTPEAKKRRNLIAKIGNGVIRALTFNIAKHTLDFTRRKNKKIVMKCLEDITAQEKDPTTDTKPRSASASQVVKKWGDLMKSRAKESSKRSLSVGWIK